MSITPQSFPNAYLKHRGIVGHNQAAELQERLNALYNSILYEHLTSHQWSFLESAEVDLSPSSSGSGAAEFITLEYIAFVQGARVSTSEIVGLNTLIPIKFDFYQVLRAQGGDTNSDNPKYLARKNKNLYPYPPPKTTGMTITIDGIIDYDNRLDTSSATIFSVPDSHQTAMFALFDYHLFNEPYEKYQIALVNLIGGEAKAATDWWGELYGSY